ncbi:putative dehydrogenase [Abditibacterium utsteinense]|uniref:Putative dehydrogenase n=1 Tax=Abditibacterium utsteinense TaxID=1960156 RepID=A0A2S8SS15_9BACT|nr:Gfo/Idh/MocA family oxidoreductase [Abditibacterium utsteinense]PQV63590.1 putative dehydrogenase [Abditibacterium utsteinense]
MKNYSSASEITVGVVGYGGAFNMGRQHLQQMQAAGMTPIAVAEVDTSRLAVASQDFPGIETYSTLDAMLENSAVDLIVLITPHNTHAPLALKCLNAGRHVICEKPIAISTAEVDAMIEAAQNSGAMLSAYHNRHWDGRILQAVELIKNQNLIGDVVRIECHMGNYGKPGDWWRTSRSISGGILYDWGVHLLEYALQLIEAPLSEVSGVAHENFWGPQTAWKEDANEDEGFVLVRFEGGQWLTLSISSIDSKGKEGWLEITGTQGTLVLDGDDSKLYQHQNGKFAVTRWPNPQDEGQHYYNNVRDHLVDGAPLVISAEWARRPIHILDLARQSAQSGRALPTIYP